MRSIEDKGPDGSEVRTAPRVALAFRSKSSGILWCVISRRKSVIQHNSEFNELKLGVTLFNTCISSISCQRILTLHVALKRSDRYSLSAHDDYVRYSDVDVMMLVASSRRFVPHQYIVFRSRLCFNDAWSLVWNSKLWPVALAHVANKWFYTS